MHLPHRHEKFTRTLPASLQRTQACEPDLVILQVLATISQFSLPSPKPPLFQMNFYINFMLLEKKETQDV